MTTGMEGFAAGASALAGQAAGLRAAVDSGKVRMTPDAAERVAKIYDDKADDLRRKTSDAQRLIVNGIYGDCFIGRDLERKFNEKVTGPESAPDAGLLPILRKTEEILRNMAQAFRDSAREMTNADDESAHNVRRSV
ncbi:hypothetical protein LZ318_35705 [Saccharopolyspora indica]|uniref:hypothetical protein n=1 Tax=Saccharopolyspora indica TaxID=1229659 RepID=UPI0022EA5DF4|nr:hypothetical protein [Saccharopolyspora indica]MDA3647307.1 hypothetical protein [Saccharopolyspora indica]